jgi:uncharacterized protein YuzE
LEEQIIQEKNIETVVEAAPYLLKFPYRKMWIDYDKEADVLYINFKRPQKATDSEMMKSGILLRYREKDLVGITILDASKRGQE